MAAAKLPFQIALEQNTNEDSTAFGKWFGKTYSTSDTLSLRGLIERVAFAQCLLYAGAALGIDVFVENKIRDFHDKP